MNNKIENKGLVLFIDASTPIFYIALKDLDKGDIVERKLTHKDLKGEALLSVVKEMFEEKRYDVHALRYLCTTKGPGSLTGLRIAMSTVKTMAQILDLPIVCLPTLYALEQSLEVTEDNVQKRFITCLTARKNSFYIRFSGTDEQSFKQISGESLLKEAENVNLLVWALGSKPLYLCDKEPVNSVIVELSSETVFKLSEMRYEKKDFLNYIDCTPEYAGKSVAERNFEKSGK